MITTNFLLEWAFRSSILISLAALISWLLRVKNPSIQLAICIAALCGSLSMPLLTAALPGLPVFALQATAASITTPARTAHVAPAGGLPVSGPENPTSSHPLEWVAAALALYVVVGSVLLLRLGLGLLLAGKLKHSSSHTTLTCAGCEVFESPEVTSPVTLGITRPAIILPEDWREWDEVRLNAVLAHEASHARRKDPALQCLSALHRAILWHTPLSWILHRRVVRLGEELSDDAALSVTHDRTTYARLLLDFMARGNRVSWQGVAMARYDSAESRIQRILHATVLSTGVTRGAIAAIFAVAVPVAWMAAAAVPAQAVRATPSTPGTPAAIASPANISTPPAPPQIASAQTPAAPPKPATQRQRSANTGGYLIVLSDTHIESWNSSDSLTTDALRTRFGNRFAILRRPDGLHTITDEGVLKEIERAMEPQKKVNTQQDEVNRLQTAVNRLQDKVNLRQNDVNAAQGKVNTQQDRINAAQGVANKRQDLLNRIQEAGSRDSNEVAIRKVEALLNELRSTSSPAGQEEVNRLQSQVHTAQNEVNRLQQEVNLEQNNVNAEQNKVNREQSKVNQLQGQVSAEFSKRIQEIFDAALRRGLTRRAN